jgi:hypothetical protein
MDLLPKVIRWVNTTSQSMGNWVSKENIFQDDQKYPAGVNIAPVPVATGEVPLGPANGALKKHGKLILIGFDVLQLPRYKMTFRLRKLRM